MAPMIKYIKMIVYNKQLVIIQPIPHQVHFYYLYTNDNPNTSTRTLSICVYIIILYLSMRSVA